MYSKEPIAQLLRAKKGDSKRSAVPRNVVLLGVTSLLTDASQEMVSVILPIYLVYALELSPAAVGYSLGIYQSGAALAAVAAGFVADRLRRVKEVALFGYALSAVCKLALLAAGSSTLALTSVVIADRVGKGVRTAPRDALLAASAAPGEVGRAFGVHRALDAAGAMLGPLLAFGLLRALRGAFDVIFVVSFVIAAAGVALLALLVDGPPRKAGAPAAPATSLRDALAALTEPAFARLVIASGLLSLFAVNDGLVYLMVQRRADFAIENVALLSVASAFVFMLLARPAGRLADRVGALPALLAGYGALAVLYVALAFVTDGWIAASVSALCVGAFYAATDGIVAAWASTLLPEAQRTVGLSVLTTVTSLARIASAVIFGALWGLLDAQVTLIVFAAGLTIAAVVCSVVLRHDARPRS